MKTRLLFLPLLLAAALSLGFHGHAPDQSSGGWSLEEKFFAKAHFMLAEEEALGLSEEQVRAVRSLKMEVKKRLIQDEAQVETLAVDLHSLFYEDTVDLEQVNPLIDKKFEIKREKAKFVAGAIAKLKAILSDEQRQTLKGLWKKKGA